MVDTMGREIYSFQDGTLIEFDSGSFDHWCVYITIPGQERYAPKDIEYFDYFRQLGEMFGNDVVYEMYCEVYEKVDGVVSREVMKSIIQRCGKFQEECKASAIWFIVVYAGMVAEENKRYTKLGKRIKRLGMHQVLCEGMSPEDAAQFSKGMKWKEINKICVERGF
jgi:hypothetical protein